MPYKVSINIEMIVDKKFSVPSEIGFAIEDCLNHLSEEEKTNFSFSIKSEEIPLTLKDIVL